MIFVHLVHNLKFFSESHINEVPLLIARACINPHSGFISNPFGVNFDENHSQKSSRYQFIH